MNRLQLITPAHPEHSRGVHGEIIWFPTKRSALVMLAGILRLLLYGALGLLPGALFCTPTQDPAHKLVNKKVSLGTYKPEDLISFQGVQISKRIVPDLKRLLAAAKKEGLTLRVQSGYRSFERQKQVYNSWIKKELKKKPGLKRAEAIKRADRYSARPGHSEHQLGTTVDILSSENGYQFSCDRKWRYVGWLERNAHRFNFKISYGPQHPEYQYEPWHLRWYPELSV